MLKQLALLSIAIAFFTSCSNTNTSLDDNTLLKNAQKYSLKDDSLYTTIEKKPLIFNKPPRVKVSKATYMNKALLDFYEEWKNVKYKMGGNSKKGIDCSAFTQRVFKEKFFVNIPRTTRTQVNIGQEIQKSELQLGDLVFFKTGKTDRHVGIFMGNGDFLHASIEGIKFTKLDKPFYKKSYWTSRRILY